MPDVDPPFYPVAYVMGASGVGKDSLLHHARSRLASHEFIFAHRYITRPPADGENHVALSESEFRDRRNAGLFAFDWHSHGLRYGIGVEMLGWQRRGLRVVINGSREAWPRLSERPELALFPLLVVASPETREKRLAARNREAAQDQMRRLAREVVFDADAMVTIANDGLLSEAGDALVAALRAIAPILPGATRPAT